VSNLPDVLPVDDNSRSQGDYDLAIAIDPLDANVIYLGGSYSADPQFWPASIWRCRLQARGSGYQVPRPTWLAAACTRMSMCSCIRLAIPTHSGRAAMAVSS